MPAQEPLCRLIGINPQQLSKEENILLEIELLARLCEELKEVFREQQKDFFHFKKLTIDKENKMLELHFIKLIIQDIVLTEEYNLQGIAYYTDTPLDVIYDVVSGKNVSPSSTFLQKIIELHRTVRRELYHSIIKKITKQYLAVA